MVEEIYIMRFLSLSNNRISYKSKQELKNDKNKGKDNYPRTITGILNLIQYHNLRGKGAARIRFPREKLPDVVLFT